MYSCIQVEQRRQQCLDALKTVVPGEADKVADWLASAACDDDEATSAAAAAVLMALHPFDEVRTILRNEGLAETLRGLPSPPADSEAARCHAALIAWLEEQN